MATHMKLLKAWGKKNAGMIVPVPDRMVAGMIKRREAEVYDLPEEVKERADVNKAKLAKVAEDDLAKVAEHAEASKAKRREAVDNSKAKRKPKAKPKTRRKSKAKAKPKSEPKDD